MSDTTMAHLVGYPVVDVAGKRIGIVLAVASGDVGGRECWLIVGHWRLRPRAYAVPASAVVAGDIDGVHLAATRASVLASPEVHGTTLSPDTVLQLQGFWSAELRDDASGSGPGRASTGAVDHG